MHIRDPIQGAIEITADERALVDSPQFQRLRNVKQLEVSKLFDPSLIDEILEIDYELAYTRALQLCQTEGLLAGPSSGLIYEGTRRIIERDQTGFGVMIFPDNVFKYTSNMVKHIPGLAAGTRP